MSKRSKSAAQVFVADGTGGMVGFEDRRFDKGAWPIEVPVAAEHSDRWFRAVSAECQHRNWLWSDLKELGRAETSGSTTIRSCAGPDSPELIVRWSRRRDGPLCVRARLAGTPEFPSELAAEFFATIQERCSKMAKTLFHCWGQLHYEGLPWRGEFWLDDRLRLGPPSREEGPVPPFNLPMLWGPRVILVDAQVEALDGQDAGSAFREKLRELAIFLSIVTRIEISMPRNNVRTWTCRPDVNGQIECEVRQLGYHEPNLLQEMPAKGTTPPVRLKTVARPDLSLYGLHNRDETEQWLPEDVVHLWRQFTSLPPDRRRQFLQAGNQWRLALAFHQESQTDSFAKMVVACEALKPPGQESDYFNVYDVVEALWGRAFADGLRRDGLRPQELRNAYFHRGEVQGDEIREPVWLSTFEDPSFSRALLAFQPVPPAAILEWLRLGGSLPPMRPKRLDWRRRFAMTPTSLAFVSLGSSVCAALGWLLHAWLAR